MRICDFPTLFFCETCAGLRRVTVGGEAYSAIAANIQADPNPPYSHHPASSSWFLLNCLPRHGIPFPPPRNRSDSGTGAWKISSGNVVVSRSASLHTTCRELRHRLLSLILSSCIHVFYSSPIEQYRKMHFIQIHINFGMIALITVIVCRPKGYQDTSGWSWHVVRGKPHFEKSIKSLFDVDTASRAHIRFHTGKGWRFKVGH